MKSMSLIVAALAAYSALASGQQKPAPTQPPAGYPSKPIRIIVTSVAGGGLEVVTRLIMEKVGQKWGQATLIDVRSGGTGVLGTQITAAAPADGYTLLSTGDSLIINDVLKQLPQESQTTLAPIAQTTVQYYFMFVNPSVPANSVKELISYAKSNPAKLNFASSGTGGVAHLGMEWIKQATGVDIVHVPYKGNSQIVLDLAAGRVDMMFGGLTVLPMVKTGQVKLIGAMSPKRLAQIPDVPTVAESGIPGYQLSNTYAMYAPIKTPISIISFLNKEIIEAAFLPELVARFATDWVEPAPDKYKPEELKKILRAEHEKWDRVIKKANIKADSVN